MDLRIDEKGKYYTVRVSKDTVPAFIRTADQVIIGQTYIRPERRLKDELDSDTSRFLPITDASVYDATSERLLYRTALLLVSYQHIQMISPLALLESFRDEPWAQQTTEREMP